MERDDLLKHAIALRGNILSKNNGNLRGFNTGIFSGDIAKVSEFLRVYAGPKSSFFQKASGITGSDQIIYNDLESILSGFIEYVRDGLHADVAPERKAQLDVVSDFLEQAQILLENKAVHAAAPLVLIGATLEEFLRTWVEAENISLGNKKPSLQNYADLLKEKDLITKQDVKDVTAWGGIRNSAAHGEWDAVADKARARLMLEGINLFMRKYGV
jgi:hypothetical protein